jgi:regulatory protein
LVIYDPYKSVLTLLGRKERSSKEVKDHLSKIGVDKKLVPQYIQALVEDGLLSDARFTEEKIRVRLYRNGWGPIKISEELYIHQVDRELVQARISAIEPSEWEKACTDQIKKYQKKNKDSRYIKNRLLENGFDESMINRILKASGIQPIEV